jgi:hypothetical protein
VGVDAAGVVPGQQHEQHRGRMVRRRSRQVAS